jgi:hypothetical protein
MALWGNVEVYGPGVLVTTNLIVPASQASPGRRETWTVRVRNVELQLGLPNASYQFSPLLISNEVLANYSRPDRVRLCPDKRMDCDGALLTNPFRAIRLDGDFALVRQPSGSVGWAWLPNLSEAQGEVVDFTSALISYLRGDFEQAERFFERVGNSKADGVVRHDAALLAALSRFRRGQGIDALQDVHTRNPYSLFAVQALVMAHIVTATAERGEARRTRVNEAKTLVASYRDLFPPRDPWLSGADRSLRLLN